MTLSTITNAINAAEKYPHLTKIGVFGSYARGDATETSDLDIIFEYDHSNTDYLENIDDFMEDMERQIPTQIDYVTLNSLQTGELDYFTENILQDVKWIYIKQPQ